MSQDEQIYGRQSGQTDEPLPGNGDGRRVGDEGMQESDPEGFGREEVMQDPWGGEKSSGWFGENEGGDGGDGGGDWGDIGGGDWS